MDVHSKLNGPAAIPASLSPFRWLARLRDIALLACLLTAAAPAWAATAASGNAYGLAVSAQLAPLLLGPTASVTLSPIPSVSGTAPPDYAVPGTAASATAAVTGLPTLVSTGVLNANTTATLATDISQSTASVDNLNVSVAGLIGLTATAVASSASVTCTAGAVVPSGGSTLTGAALTLLNLPVGVLAAPAPNTGINALGISIVLNEQIVTANSITVNAIHISINNALLALIGNLTADIVVGHSSATLDSTCPPATAPDLALSISQPVPALVAGQTSQITVTLSNVGTAVAPGPQTVTVVLPAGVSAPASFANGGWTCTNAGGTVTCTNPAGIAAGTASAFTIDVTPSAATVGTTPTITASTPPLTGEINTANNSTSMTSAVAVAPSPPGTAPDLTLSISQPTPNLVALQPSTITVTLSNVGTAAAPGAQTVVVSLPSEVTAPASFSGAGWSCTNAAGTITCGNPNAIGAGSSSAIVMTVTPTSGSVGATPTVTATTPPAVGEINIANNSASMTTSVAVAAAPPSPAPDLQLTLSQPTPSLVAGQSSTIAVTLANIGSANAAGPQSVTVNLPAGFGTAGSFGSNGWSCTVSGTVASCGHPGAIGVGGNSSFTMVVTPANGTVGTTPTFTASTPAAPGETNLGNNSTSMTADVAVAAGPPNPQPDLQLSIAQPAPGFVADQPSSVVVTLSNIGNATAAAPLTITVALPAGLAAPSTFNGGGFTCTTSGSTVSCSSGAALAAGASVAIAIAVTPGAGTIGTKPSITASTPAAVGETNLANNQASMTAAVAVGGGGGPGPTPVPDLALTLGQPVPAFVANVASDVAVTVTNVGDATAAGPQSVTVTLPSGLAAPASTSNGGWTCTASGATVTCTSPASLPPGASTSFALSTTPSAATVGTTPTFVAATPAAAGEINLANNTASMTSAVTVSGGGGPNPPTPPAGRPDLLLTIGAPVPGLVVGEISLVPVTLSNIGTASAAGPFTVTISLPPQTLSPPAVDNGTWSCHIALHMATCSASIGSPRARRPRSRSRSRPTSPPEATRSPRPATRLPRPRKRTPPTTSRP